ncbi:uncharacterized protein IL334_003288 [Kwoniella shivajii]|uniref:Uncharacterized protein n=1 Tax=Kwoniella shivajii TaxID=564305 RepID=A0ABZ1CX62_9TREE|nr:hypothetical protein IL334_003288 [Kwoniella shivajii]
MDTPNTRSRRKRELENSSQEDGLKVAWVHDSQLRKAVLQATEDDIISPPTPTQRPRPISSLLNSSSSGITSSSSSSSNRPPRKRPCRAHRSLPTSMRQPQSGYGEPSSGPSSLPSMSILSSNATSISTSTSSTTFSGQGERTKLDYLLDRISLLSSPMEEAPYKKRETFISEPKELEIETPSRNLRSKNQPKTSGIIHSTPLKYGINKALNQNTKSNINNQPPLLNNPQEIFRTDKPAHSSTPTRKPLSPIKGVAPRIGLGSQHKSNNKNTVKTGWTRTNSGRAFRTPFLEADENVRSSPGRINQFHNIRNPSSGGSVRGPSLLPPIQSKSLQRPINSRSNTSSSSSANSSLPPTPPIRAKEKHLIEFKNFDVGENEPEDTSFDSFDGIFAGGGEEIERLLRRIDGSD